MITLTTRRLAAPAEVQKQELSKPKVTPRQAKIGYSMLSLPTIS
jgi:hypothetical protein